MMMIALFTAMARMATKGVAGADPVLGDDDPRNKRHGRYATRDDGGILYHNNPDGNEWCRGMASGNRSSKRGRPMRGEDDDHRGDHHGPRMDPMRGARGRGRKDFRRYYNKLSIGYIVTFTIFFD